MLSIDDLYGEYAAGLQAYATRLARDGQVAEDLVQETFIRTLGHLQLLAQLNPHQRRAWLCQTVKRLFLDRQASRAREVAAIAQLSLETEGYAPPVEPQLLDALLERVPESWRNAGYLKILAVIKQHLITKTTAPAPHRAVIFCQRIL